MRIYRERSERKFRGVANSRRGYTSALARPQRRSSRDRAVVHTDVYVVKFSVIIQIFLYMKHVESIRQDNGSYVLFKISFRFNYQFLD
ncbi:hypothetical protein PUN28_016701 [Cardiocondyla obscurior]|uniref:Uncharacterized protein n=1 Tax=Cardiocondyla obscurior TaxID=286306 RepID=A0AAW2EU66_9HYME